MTICSFHNFFIKANNYITVNNELKCKKKFKSPVIPNKTHLLFLYVDHTFSIHTFFIISMDVLFFIATTFISTVQKQLIDNFAIIQSV